MNIKFLETDEDNYKFELPNNIGSLYFEYIFNLSADYFVLEPDLFTEIQFTKLFPNDMCLFLKYLEIRPENRNKGYAKILMDKFLQYFNNQNKVNTIVLNACPYGSEPRLNIDELSRFYRNYHFKPILKNESNILMYLTK